MNFAALAFSGERMAKQLRIYERATKKEPQKKPGNPRSDKYVRLCERLFDLIQVLDEAHAPDTRLDDVDSRSVSRALKLLKSDGKIVYRGDSPHGYWCVKAKGNES